MRRPMTRACARFRDSDTTLAWLLRIAVFFYVGIYGWHLFNQYVTGPVHLSILDPLKPYIHDQFIGSAYGRISKLIWFLGWYAIWMNIIEKKRKIPKLLKPKTSIIKAYLLGMSLGTLIFLTTYFIYIWIGIIKFQGVNLSLSHIMINVFGVLALSSCTSIVEELACRGFLITRLEERWNIHIVVIIQAIVFGFMHVDQGFNMLWTTTLAGLMLGYLFVNTRNLYASIGMHSSIHLVNVIEATFNFQHDESQGSIFYLLGAGNMLGFVGQVGLIVVTISLILLYIGTRKVQ